MTISSSLIAGVAGLNVNASRLATISDNIANSSTYGYKRAVADFHSQVLSNGIGAYTAGGVRVTTHREIEGSGSLVTTNNPTDLSIDGRGMLPVTSAASVKAGATPLPFMMTSTGSFHPDANGVLTTDSGLVLLGWPAKSDGTIPPYPRDAVGGLVPLAVEMNQFAGDPTTSINLGVNVPATETKAGSSGTPVNLSVEYFGNLGTSESLDMVLTPTVPATGQSNQWKLSITDSASGGTPVGEYNLVFDDTRGAGGTLASVTRLSGGAYDPATGEIGLTVGGGPLSLNIGMPGQAGGLSQLSSSFAPVSITKDGSPVGNLTSIEIDSTGYVNAVYDAGFSRTIFQVPLVEVPNPNGLSALDNQSYQISNESGSFFLWPPSEGPAGKLIGFSREESTTDVAAELTQLIQTQRAYSSNAKIIQTVDQMLQETTNIKR